MIQPIWVLGGGGVAGIAWEIGILTGLADEGAVVAADAVVLGTSAGAVVGAQVTSGIPLAKLYARQEAGVPWETSAGMRLSQILRLARAQFGARSPERAAARIGRLAEAAHVADPNRQRAIAQARLPKHAWSNRDLRIVAVDTASGASRVFTRADAVPLVDAVAASCAVPFVSAPVPLDGRRWMDGGMRSTLNLDLAPGSGPVIALAPSTAAIGPWARIARQRALLAPDRRVEILLHDADSRRAAGRDVMDRSVAPQLVAAGRAQGRREAERVRAALQR